MRGRTILLALALAIPAACDARAPEPVAYEKLSVPFDGLRSHENPTTPYTDLVARLKRKAADEARDDRFAPVVSTRFVGLRGERMLVAAITPAKGVFYYTDYGPYPLDDGPMIVLPRGEIEVCRFIVRWDELPAGAYVPGLVWADAAVPFPGLDCNRRADPKIASVVAKWRRVGEGATSTVVANGAGPGLKASLVREAWPGRLDPPPGQAFDGARAAAAVAGGKDRIVRAIPLSEDQEFYVEAASGRTFVGIDARSLSYGTDARCIVEGLHWRDLASSDGRRRSAAVPLCNRLLKEYSEASRSKQGGPPPHVISTLPVNR